MIEMRCLGRVQRVTEFPNRQAHVAAGGCARRETESGGGRSRRARVSRQLISGCELGLAVIGLCSRNGAEPPGVVLGEVARLATLVVLVGVVLDFVSAGTRWRLAFPSASL